MSAGNSLFNVVAGGGNQRANASQLARWICQLGVCTGGAPGTLYNPGSDVTNLRSLMGVGPLAEAGAFRQRGGQPCYLMPTNPSSAGAVSSAVTVTGSLNAIMALSLAPHVPITVLCSTGGALGTAAFQFSVNGGAFSAPVLSSASAPWTYPVPGTFCTLSFPAATYVATKTMTVGINGTVTLGSGWVGSVTQTSSPTDVFEMLVSVATVGGFGTGMLTVSPDGGPSQGGSTMPNQILPTNGVIVIPNTGIVLTIGQHTIVVTITTPGSLGTAVFSYTVDGGSAVTGNTTTPNSGSNFVFTVPNTGVTLTFTPGSYVNSSTYTIGPLGGAPVIGGGGINNVTFVWAGFQANDTYSFLAAPPGSSTTDLANALTNLQNARNVQFTAVHFVQMPNSAASAASAQATMDAAMQNAANVNFLDWQGLVEYPSNAGRGGLGDVVISGGFAIADTADTDAVVTASRGSDTNRTAVHVATYRLTSSLTGFKQARPLGWLVADRFVDTDPASDISAVANGPLRAFIPPGATTIGRDESITAAMDNVQFNSARTYPFQGLGIYLTITAGGAGWKNCTQQASWQDARGVRVLNVLLQQLRPFVQFFMGQSPATNPDGTIDEFVRRAWTGQIDTVAKRGVGLLPAGPFSTRQASFASATVSAASQLGQSPKQLVVNYFLQQLGFVSSIQNNMYFSGTLVLGS
jgi:hypothetical protein